MEWIQKHWYGPLNINLNKADSVFTSRLMCNMNGVFVLTTCLLHLLQKKQQPQLKVFGLTHKRTVHTFTILAQDT